MNQIYTDFSLNALANLQVKRSAESFRECVHWSLSDWITAITGELGEAANNIKKLNRKDPCKYVGEWHDKAAVELADTLCYLLITMKKLDVDIEGVFARKFNKVSEKVGSPLRLYSAGVMARPEGEDV